MYGILDQVEQVGLRDRFTYDNGFLIQYLGFSEVIYIQYFETPEYHTLAHLDMPSLSEGFCNKTSK